MSNPIAQQIRKTVETISAAIPQDYLTAIGASNLVVASERTIRFDVQDKEGGGITRVKVSLQPDGDLRLRTYRIEDGEDVPNITPASLQEALKNIAGIQPKN